MSEKTVTWEGLVPILSEDETIYAVYRGVLLIQLVKTKDPLWVYNQLCIDAGYGEAAEEADAGNSFPDWDLIYEECDKVVFIQDGLYWTIRPASWLDLKHAPLEYWDTEMELVIEAAHCGAKK